MSVSIQIENVVKKYGEVTIIPDLSSVIENGEFFTLLGPSGCGKTTLLRMIAGFNSIEGGQISFDSNPINLIPAHKRNIGMVFQNYAIFPHLTVRQNVEYGLKLRKTPKDEMKKKVDDILKAVRIEEYQDRLPERLSGGQQQRVALARSIVIHPNVLLMDEPLSNLDAKLRIEMRAAIRDVQKEVGITTVYVTHDQEEALAISDRIAVMNKGEIQQVGQPYVIYTRPSNVFVSTFIGHSNLFKGKLENGVAKFVDNYQADVSKYLAKMDEKEVIIGVRPEEFVLDKNGMKCTVKTTTFLGRYVNYELNVPSEFILDDQSIEFSQDIGISEKVFQPGDEIYLGVRNEKINVFSKDGKSIMKGVLQND
jgi:iron(III) transport system ATP-binding protein